MTFFLCLVSILCKKKKEEKKKNSNIYLIPAHYSKYSQYVKPQKRSIHIWNKILNSQVLNYFVAAMYWVLLNMSGHRSMVICHRAHMATNVNLQTGGGRGHVTIRGNPDELMLVQNTRQETRNAFCNLNDGTARALEGPNYQHTRTRCAIWPFSPNPLGQCDTPVRSHIDRISRFNVSIFSTLRERSLKLKTVKFPDAQVFRDYSSASHRQTMESTIKKKATGLRLTF